jgi:hypothetical protein
MKTRPPCLNVTVYAIAAIEGTLGDHVSGIYMVANMTHG